MTKEMFSKTAFEQSRKTGWLEFTFEMTWLFPFITPLKDENGANATE